MRHSNPHVAMACIAMLAGAARLCIAAEPLDADPAPPLDVPATTARGDVPEPPAVPILRGIGPLSPKPSQQPSTRTRDLMLDKPKDGLEAFYELFLKGRLSVGIRYTSFDFDETLRPEDETRTETFLGYVNEIEFTEDSSVEWVIAYELCPYLAVEYSQDEVSARTWNFNNGLSDGVLKMSGPLYGVTLRWPIRSWFCPYIGIGYADWKAEFQHEEWWMLGYSSEESYRRQGSTGTPVHSHRRIIEVEDDSCTFMIYGLSVKLHRHLELDMMMRKLELTSKAGFYHEFGGVPALSREGEFPLNHTSYGIALKGIF